MRFSAIVLLIATVALPASASGFYEEMTLGSGDTVIVAGSGLPLVRLVFNRDLNPGPTTWPGGCTLVLTLEEAELIGETYQWAASEDSPQVVDEVFEVVNGGPWGAALTISRTWTTFYLESTLDDGASPTSMWCTYVEMTEDEAAIIGDWLVAASNP